MDKFIRQGLPGVIHIRKIITIFYMELSKDFHYDGEQHNFWEMVYIDKEKCSAQQISTSSP